MQATTTPSMPWRAILPVVAVSRDYYFVAAVEGNFYSVAAVARNFYIVAFLERDFYTIGAVARDFYFVAATLSLSRFVAAVTAVAFVLLLQDFCRALLSPWFTSRAPLSSFWLGARHCHFHWRCAHYRRRARLMRALLSTTPTRTISACITVVNADARNNCARYCRPRCRGVMPPTLPLRETTTLSASSPTLPLSSTLCAPLLLVS